MAAKNSSERPVADAAPGGECAVPFERVAKFMRQYSHDARNHLGVIDLQAAYLAELVAEPEAVAELGKLRGLVKEAALAVAAVASRFCTPTPNFLRLDGALAVEALRERLGQLCPQEAPQLVWVVELAGGELTVDLELVCGAVAELVRNACYFQEPPGPVQVKVSQREAGLQVELTEALRAMPEAPERWGLVPFESARRGGYGLGLFYARRLLALHGGALSFVWDQARSRLVTVAVFNAEGGFNAEGRI